MRFNFTFITTFVGLIVVTNAEPLSTDNGTFAEELLPIIQPLGTGNSGNLRGRRRLYTCPHDSYESVRKVDSGGYMSVSQ